jgi:amidase
MLSIPPSNTPQPSSLDQVESQPRARARTTGGSPLPPCALSGVSDSRGTIGGVRTVDLAPSGDFATAGVPEIVTGLESGEFTSADVVAACLGRIRAISVGGPHLNAVRCVNPRVYAEAAALDRERSRGRVRGPLHGVPVLLKDNIDAVGMPTTAGSIALAASFPAADAVLVARLRDAGAIILGKTNLTEFANYIAQDMPSGYSSLAGQVLNPYDASQTPSGSSSGSAVAAACGLAPLTVGTETCGSILSPARANSVVGVKPTVGAVSRTGIVPIAPSQDTAGPITRTVYDAAALLTAIIGRDPEDPATADNPLVGVDLVAGLSADALRGTRLGYVPDEDELYRTALSVLHHCGAELVEVTVVDTAAETILNLEFKRALNAYLARLPEDAPVRSFDGIYRYNLDHPQGRKYGQAAFEISAGVELADPDQLAAYEKLRDQGITETRTAIDAVLSEHDLAAVVSRSETIAVGARAGYPSVTVPIGYAEEDGRPASITFLGTRWSEPTLLPLAYAYEQASRLRRPPEDINPSLFRGSTLDDPWTAPLAIPDR